MATSITVLLICLGETFSILAEFIASRKNYTPTAQHLFVFGTPLVLIVVGGAFLVAGYVIGYHQLRNIWIVSAISIGSILVVEPPLALLMFHQLPTRGAALGFVLGIAGLVAALIN